MSGRGADVDLSGVRVLVLEDDFYLAMDLQDALTACGATVIGPFRDAEEAIREVERETPDAALVDVNLGQGPEFTLPARLLESGVPFAFVTGYDRAAVPSEFARVPRVEKPVSTVAATRAAAALLSRS